MQGGDGVLNLEVYRKESRISDSDRTTLTTIKNPGDVIVKAADKGGGIIVWENEIDLMHLL